MDFDEGDDEDLISNIYWRSIFLAFLVILLFSSTGYGSP
jgi:hypothetical protein